MKILMTITTDSELISYEALALAFVLASFDHPVQLYLDGDVFEVLCDKHSRIYGMIQSLELYDMPKAWINPHNKPKLLDALLPYVNEDFDSKMLQKNQISIKM